MFVFVFVGGFVNGHLTQNQKKIVNAIGSDGVCELAFLECLEFLNLTETGVDDRGIRMLCLGESRHKLTHLLAACNQIGSDGIQSIVRHMPQLQHLSIEDNPFCAQDFRAMVVGLPACRILRGICLCILFSSFDQFIYYKKTAAIPANVIRGDEPTRTWANELCYQGQQEHLITEAMLAEWICSNATQQETEEWKQRQQQADNEKEEFDASWAEHQRLLTE